MSSTRGATKDLTATFMKYRNGSLDSDESDATADPKARFLVRNTGFASSVKSPEVSYVNDRGALLPTSTKASSEEENSSEGGIQGATSIQMSSRHLPPVYVDIQEEIESNLDEINKQST